MESKDQPKDQADWVADVKHIPDNYLVEWYIGVAKRRGWDEVVRLLKQYPKDEERMKQLIKKRLGKWAQH